MASTPDILEELPWLKTAQRDSRKAQLLRYGRSALILGVLAVPILFFDGHFVWSSGVPGPPPAPATPAVIDDPFAPKALRPLSADQAETWNSKIPQSDIIAPATPFMPRTDDGQSYSRSLQCMTAAIYYEAANEPVDGQRAVAQVILNRVRSPVYPHSVCGVVYQGSERKTGCQFTFTCDGSLARTPSPASWARASMVAASALGGYVHAPVGWATNYHADYVVPYWAQSLQKLATIGRHIFYGWKGASGSAAAFTSRYAGVEPEVAGALNIPLSLPSTVAIDQSPGVVRVTSSERPLIGFTGPESAAPPAPTAGLTPKKESETAPPTVGIGARWVIGAAGHTTSLRRPPSQITLPPAPEAGTDGSSGAANGSGNGASTKTAPSASAKPKMPVSE